MVRNLAGLKRNAQLRSDGAMSRATAAIRKMQSEEVQINFRSVAVNAGVSTAWLYRTKSLRDKIMKTRTTSPAIGGEVPQQHHGEQAFRDRDRNLGDQEYADEFNERRGVAAVRGWIGEGELSRSGHVSCEVAGHG